MQSRPKGRLDPADAQDCSDLASSYGLTPDDWQLWVIQGWLSRVPRTGKLAASRCGLAVPRQNGKNAILEAVELFKMVVQGRRVLHTAHEVKTARKAFIRLCSFFENPRRYPELSALVRDVRKTNGQEAIFLTNGGSVEFIARSKGSGRGFTVDDLVCDEAQELSDDALAALYPTISAAPSGDPQLILTGTPPSPNMSGGVFTRFRDAGVLGRDARLCWDEWSLPADADLNDPNSWAVVNPALGIRLGIEVIRDERAAMDDETFGRERGGQWDDVEVGSALPQWGARHNPDLALTTPDAIGLAASVDHAWGSIAAASGTALVTVGAVDRRRGTAWLVDEAVRIQREYGCVVVIDKGGPLSDLIPTLTDAGVRLTELDAGGYCDACASMARAVEEGTLQHPGHPELDAAVRGASWRPIGDRRAFARKNSEISMLEAATLAFSQHDSKPDPGVYIL